MRKGLRHPAEERLLEQHDVLIRSARIHRVNGREFGRSLEHRRDFRFGHRDARIDAVEIGARERHRIAHFVPKRRIHAVIGANGAVHHRGAGTWQADDRQRCADFLLEDLRMTPKPVFGAQAADQDIADAPGEHRAPRLVEVGLGVQRIQQVLHRVHMTLVAKILETGFGARLLAQKVGVERHNGVRHVHFPACSRLSIFTTRHVG